MFTLSVKTRASAGDNTALRESGVIPAVFYGAGKETTPITVSQRDFEKVWKQAGESSPVTLKTESGEVSTLIHEVQVHPVTGMALHADFLVVDMNKEVEVKIPLEFVGESGAVKGGLGTLVKVLHELEVMALPADLPHSIEVDISPLVTLENQIHVSDIKTPKGVKIMTGADEVVALVQAQKEEVEEAPVDLSAIEVEKKGKKEEEGAEAPAEEPKE